MGVDYLCQFVDGKTAKVPELSQYVKVRIVGLPCFLVYSSLEFVHSHFACLTN